MNVTGPQGTPLQIPVLVEHEERMQALRLEVAVPDRALLVAMDRAFGTVHVQRDALRCLPVVHGVDPAAGKVGQGFQILGPGQHLGLEPAHSTRRGSTVLHRPIADELPHHRITAEPVGIIDVLIACETREDRLSQEAGEKVPTVPAGARIGDQIRGHVGQAKGVIEFAVKQQAAVGADGRTMEREFDGAVELEPQGPGLRFTRRVRRHRATPSLLSHCYREDITPSRPPEAFIIWGMRDLYWRQKALSILSV